MPCEIASETFHQDWYDDFDIIANGWVTDYVHPVWGRLEQPGHFVEFSDTQAKIHRPPPVVGQHTVEILSELGYDPAHVEALRAAAVVAW